MRLSIISILSFSAAVLAQDLSGLPRCAQTAAISAAANSGCDVTDASCLCQNDGFIASLKATIVGSCTGSDAQTACTLGNSACGSYGVKIDCGGATAAGTNTAMSPTTSSGTTSTTEAMTSSSMMSSSTMSGSMMTMMSSSIMASTNMTLACTHGCGNMTHAATSMVSKTGSAPTSQYTGAASTAARHSVVVGFVTGAAFVLAFL